VKEAELVLTHVLNCDRLSLYLNKGAVLDKEQSAQVAKIFQRRIGKEPLQYILGKCEFMGLELKIDKRALIPRPETEILVESAINELKTAGNLCPKVFDLGTGSGCIAISIARLFPKATVWAADISEAALELAKENAGLHNVKIKFLLSDLFSGLKDKRFDLIISNPPYISTSEFCGLAKEISFEPELALKAGIDGLDFYRRIIKFAGLYLNDHGLLALEMGMNQAGLIEGMLEKEKYSDIKIIKDYNNIERVIIARKP